MFKTLGKNLAIGNANGGIPLARTSLIPKSGARPSGTTICLITPFCVCLGRTFIPCPQGFGDPISRPTSDLCATVIWESNR